MTGQPAKPWVIALVLVAGLAIIAGGWWHADRRAAQVRQTTEAAQRVQAILDEFRKDLPRPYAPGLELRDVAFEGNDLVMTIRSLKRRADASDPGLGQIAQAEKSLMLPLRDQPDVLFLLARGVVIKRRFVDGDGGLFFEISLTSADCTR